MRKRIPVPVGRSIVSRLVLPAAKPRRPCSDQKENLHNLSPLRFKYALFCSHRLNNSIQIAETFVKKIFMKNLNKVHLNGLKAVEAIGRLGSLPKAAEELGVSVSAVSQQLIRTEAQIGHALFDRTGSGLVSTSFGKGFLARLAEGFEHLSKAVALAEGVDQTLLLSVAPTFASKWLVPRLGRLRAAYPDLKIRIEIGRASCRERVFVGV